MSLLADIVKVDVELLRCELAQQRRGFVGGLACVCILLLRTCQADAHQARLLLLLVLLCSMPVLLLVLPILSRLTRKKNQMPAC
jgi:hypothetical protein